VGLQDCRPDARLVRLLRIVRDADRRARRRAPKSRLAPGSRFTRASPAGETGLGTAASGQSQRQKGMRTKSEPGTIAPAMTQAHGVMSLPRRPIRA